MTPFISVKYYGLFLTIFFMISCTQEKSDLEIVQTVLDKYETALNSKSATTISQCFHEEAILLPEGKNTLKGSKAITSHFKSLETDNFQEKLAIEEVIRADKYLIVQTKSTENPLEETSGAKGQMMIYPDKNGVWKIYSYAYSSNKPTAPTYPKNMEGSFVHTVFFWLKEPSNQDMQNAFETSLTKFIKNSKYVNLMHIGTPADTHRPVIDNSYSYCLVLTFPSKEEQDKYQAEPVHKTFINESKNLWKKVLVYDSVRLSSINKGLKN